MTMKFDTPGQDARLANQLNAEFARLLESQKDTHERDSPEMTLTPSPLQLYIAGIIDKAEYLRQRLLIQPNEKTIAAMEEARAGNLPRFDTIKELMADLNDLKP